MKASSFHTSASTTNVSSGEVSRFIAAIKRCSRSRDLTQGKTLHQEAVSLTLHTNKFVAALLTTMYSRCHCMQLARKVFDEMICKDVVSWNSLILGYVENGNYVLALDLFTNMDCLPNPGTYVAALKGCIGLRTTGLFEHQFCLEKGMDIHKRIIQCGDNHNISLAATLVDVYSKCGSIRHAREVFEGITNKDTVLWTTLALAYIENGDCLIALDLYFFNMDSHPDSFTYVAALKACAALCCCKPEIDKHFCLEKGIHIHKQIQDCGLDSSLIVSNALVDMYSKVGSMKHARRVFQGIRTPDVVSWTSLLLGYVANGSCSEALELFGLIVNIANSATFVAACKGCGVLAGGKGFKREFCLEKGITIHKQVRDSGLSSDVIIANSLIEMYSSLGSMQHAKETFDGIVDRNVFSWTSLMLGYVENGESLLALDLIDSMDCKPDRVTYMAVLKACSTLAKTEDISARFCLEKGKSVHKKLREQGLDSERVVVNSLVDMYSRCRSMCNAREMFEAADHRDIVTWTSLILGYVENGESETALDLFSSLDLEPSAVTYVAILKACGSLSYAAEFAFEKGTLIHKEIKHRGLELDVTVANSMIDMYAKLGSMKSAKAVFDRIDFPDTVSWTTLLKGYVEHRDCLDALALFFIMDAEPSPLTYIPVIKACGILGEEVEKHFFLEKGICIHKQALDHGFEGHLALSNTLLDMYGKCGSLRHGEQVFNGMTRRDVITWTSMMLGHTRNGQCSAALDLLFRMDCEPDLYTYVVGLKSCGILGAVAAGRHIHSQLCKLGHSQDQVVANSLIDFYVRCGSVARAEALFNSVSGRDAISWNSLIAGYSSIGDPVTVLRFVREMRGTDFEMDDVTFVAVLTACSHAGLINQGKLCFISLLSRKDELTVDHYNCMVDMLGRANRLEEALTVVCNMPVEPNTTTWMTLLGACKKWRNLHVGRETFLEIVATGVEDPAAYVLMTEIYKSCA